LARAAALPWTVVSFSRCKQRQINDLGALGSPVPASGAAVESGERSERMAARADRLRFQSVDFSEVESCSAVA